jgi:hypothetical protein
MLTIILQEGRQLLTNMLMERALDLDHSGLDVHLHLSKTNRD